MIIWVLHTSIKQVSTGISSIKSQQVSLDTAWYNVDKT